MSRRLGNDLTEGSILKKIIVFSIPLALSNILQLLFNTADTLVVGYFVSDNAVAAVGSTGTLIHLVVGVFTGLSLGANVTIARAIGRNDEEKVRRLVGLSILLACVMGVALIPVGWFGARTFLTWMNCPDGVIDMAEKYIRIYFLGLPAIMLYNFCNSILRAAGDSVRPLILISISGVINVGLNILLVLAFGMDVDGVAIATVVSQLFSVVILIIILFKNNGMVKLKLKNMRFYKKEFFEVLSVGLPSGLQGSIFSLSNTIIQSTINEFGEAAVAGTVYASKLDQIASSTMSGIEHGALSIISQNYGAGKMKRVKKTIFTSSLFSITMGAIISVTVLLIGRPFVRSFTDDQEVIEACMIRLLLLGLPSCIGGAVGVLSETVRGLGKSLLATIITFSAECVLRVAWMRGAYSIYHSLPAVFSAYSVSWITALIMYIITVSVLIKKIEKKNPDLCNGQ